MRLSKNFFHKLLARYVFFLLLLIFFVSSNGVSFAIDFETALHITLSAHPVLKAIESKSIAIKGESFFWRSLLNPNFEVYFGNLATTKGGGPERIPLYSLSFAQPLLLYPIRSYTLEKVRFLESALNKELEAQRRILTSDLYSFFYTSLYLKERLKVMEENLNISRDIYGYVEKAYKLGEVTELELLRAKRDLDLATVDYNTALADFKSSLKNLEYFIGRPVDDVEGEFFSIPIIQPVDYESLPVIQLYREQKLALDMQVQIERSLAKPLPSLGAFMEKVDPNIYGFRVFFSVNLPLFYRRETEIQRLVSDIQILDYTYETELLRAKSQLESSMIRHSYLIKEYKSLNEDILPTLERSLSLAIKSYKLRAITLLELSDVKRRYIETKLYLLEILRNIHENYSRYIYYAGYKKGSGG